MKVKKVKLETRIIDGLRATPTNLLESDFQLQCRVWLVGLWLIGCCTAKGPPGETLLPVDDDYCHSMASLPFMSVLLTRRFEIVKTENYSRVRNKHTPMLINFLTFFQRLQPYSGLHRAYLSSISIRYK